MSAIPPHRALSLPGLHAYPDQLSVAAGERIGLHVSSTSPYQVSLCRLGPDLDDPSRDEILASQADVPAQVQPIHPGSYVHIEKGLAAGAVHALTVECWLYLWGIGEWQAVISQIDQRAGDPAGFGLFVTPDGRLAAGWGAGPTDPASLLGASEALPLRRWTHVAATFHAGLGALWVDGVRVAADDTAEQCMLGAAPLRIGACGVDGIANCFLEADIAMPALHGAALDTDALAGRIAARGLLPASGPDVLACWPLDELAGDGVHDRSGQGHDGRLVNHGTWLINGPAFDSATVPRYHTLDAQGQDPARDVSRRAGLRLASDDLVDCRWTCSHEFCVPHESPSGLYVARFAFTLDGQDMRYDVTFVVRRPQQRPAAPLLVLCATNTWLAYGASPFAANQPQAAIWPRRCMGLSNSHPLAPAHCTYTYHQAGQPSYFVGLRMPRPHTSPSAFYAPEGSGFAQWTRLERHLHVWLERHGYVYDVATDLDLHRQPGMLAPYQAIAINGHSEYWSQPACDGLERYLNAGGCAAVLSGNSMYWRVSFDAECQVMEQRKTRTPHDAASGADPDAVAPAGPHGEQYHSQDRQRGGLWRFADRSCAGIIGLETAGWGFADPQDFGVYRARDANHFLFHRPFSTDVETNATFGHGPDGSLPRAVGHEWDLTTATLMRMTRHWPADAAQPVPEEGVHVLAEGIRRVPGRLDAYLDWFESPVDSLDGVSCEMIYWQRPAGGRVFNAGAVGASWVLGVDDRMGRLLANVLAAFGVPYPSAGPYLVGVRSD